MSVEILQGDSLTVLRGMPADSVDCCITSPPYWRLRDFGCEGQLGLERTPEEFIAGMVGVFREVRRVLRPSGSLWLNLGDTYVGSDTVPKGWKRKDLVGIPWRVAIALHADGWYLRADVIWHKTNVKPESVRDRPTKCHEYLFLLTKSARYYYDRNSIREPVKPESLNRAARGIWKPQRDPGRPAGRGVDRMRPDQMADPRGRNKRSVWAIPFAQYRGGHTATYPPALVRPCILAGCPPGGLVLDPFAGSGTTLSEAVRLGRRAVGIELNSAYVPLIKERVESALRDLPKAA